MSRYNLTDHGFGVEIFHPAGDRSAWLQGDDYSQLMEELETAELEFEPCEAFPEFEDLQDVILSAYDDVMEEVE